MVNTHHDLAKALSKFVLVRLWLDLKLELSVNLVIVFPLRKFNVGCYSPHFVFCGFQVVIEIVLFILIVLAR
jgi:hypothetical protein